MRSPGHDSIPELALKRRADFAAEPLPALDAKVGEVCAVEVEERDPIAVWEHEGSKGRASAAQGVRAEGCRAGVSERRPNPIRADPADPRSRWLIGDATAMTASAKLRGPCPYLGRTGVFTGGANAVFYLERVPGCGRYRNVVERAKRAAPQVEVELEDELVYEIVRGRDLQPWRVSGHGLLLCPHTAETRLRAIPPDELSISHPQAFAYLSSMRSVLDARKGFSGWEQGFRAEAFYAIQRVGAYSFSPYKVAWKYIAKGFTVAVLGPDSRGRPRLPNDKVMSVAVDSPAEAFYLCALLSCSPVRWLVNAQTSGRQVSASAIANLGLPRFDGRSALHRALADQCEAGHQEHDIAPRLAVVDGLSAELFGLDDAMLLACQRQV